MRKFVGLLFLLAISLPVFAQVRLSIKDQQRFDSYYSRWQQYKAVNDRGQIVSMEKRMLDVYAHYGIPAGTPFWRVATNGHPEHVAWREHLSREERARFDDLYARWINARDHHNRFEMERVEHRMREMMAHNGIPVEVRFEEVAR
ncbi:MAG TPA: hypothetical protein VJ731_17835 [Terriglobales bacterium]|nr:hypothetical protein [Terriglobales bacterium]